MSKTKAKKKQKTRKNTVKSHHSKRTMKKGAKVSKKQKGKYLPKHLKQKEKERKQVSIAPFVFLFIFALALCYIIAYATRQAPQKTEQEENTTLATALTLRAENNPTKQILFRINSVKTEEKGMEAVGKEGFEEEVPTKEEGITATLIHNDPAQKSQAESEQEDVMEPQENSDTPYLYLHWDVDSTDERTNWIPEVLEEPLSKEDIPVAIETPFESHLVYQPTERVLHLMELTTFREAGNQCLLGQIAVAEQIRNRIISGTYGSDIDAILINGYCAVKEDDGSMHIYNGPNEITEASDSAKQAVQLALRGSNITGILLEAVTEAKREQNEALAFLDEKYYEWCFYHYNPARVSEYQIQARDPSRVPVNIRIEDHVFYAYWHPESMAINY